MWREDAGLSTSIQVEGDQNGDEEEEVTKSKTSGRGVPTIQSLKASRPCLGIPV